MMGVKSSSMWSMKIPAAPTITDAHLKLKLSVSYLVTSNWSLPDCVFWEILKVIKKMEIWTFFIWKKLGKLHLLKKIVKIELLLTDLITSCFQDQDCMIWRCWERCFPTFFWLMSPWKLKQRLQPYHRFKISISHEQFNSDVSCLKYFIVNSLKRFNLVF